MAWDGLDVKACGFIQRRVCAGDRRVELRIDRPMRRRSLRLE